MIKGAIFDLDGTILDSMPVWDTMGEKYLRILGYEPKEDINELFKSFSLQQAARYYISEYGVRATVDELIAGVNKLVEDYYFNIIPAKEGAKAFLQKLAENGVKMCVATATDKNLAQAALKRLGLCEYFSHIFTCSDVGHAKDEPVIYREALKHLGTNKCNTVVFEDALHAADTAKKDGFLTVGVQDSHTREQKELIQLCDAYIQDYLHTDDFWSFANGLGETINSEK